MTAWDRPVTWTCCAVLVIAIAGCRGPGKTPPNRNDIERESKSLEEIAPDPTGPPTSAPTTKPAATSAPADALRLYVIGRSELINEKPAEAVEDLTKAAAIDPQSADVWYDLGRADEAAGNRDAAVTDYQKAVAIEPTAVAPLLATGRLLDQAGRPEQAIDYLRRALKSSDLTEDGQSIAVHLWLARSLGAAGYVAASMKQFNAVMERLNNPSGDLRDEPSIMDVLRRPAIIDLDRAGILEAHDHYDLAVKILTRSVEVDPGDADLVGRLVDDLIKLNAPDQALDCAEKLLARNHADPVSITILARACIAVNPPRDTTDELLKIASAQPADAAIRTAVVDALTRANRSPDALAFCESCHSADVTDPAATADLVKQLLHASRPLDAAQAVIETASLDPDMTDRLEPSWVAITRPGKRSIVTAADLAKLPGSEGARDWYLSRLLDDIHRKGESAAVLANAVNRRPVFAPAFGTALDRIETDPRQDAAWKKSKSDELARTAETAGAPWLAVELRGRTLVDAGNIELARTAFSTAREMNPHSAEVRFAAAKIAGSKQEIEFSLWQVVADFPSFVGSYRALSAIYLAQTPVGHDQLEQLAVAWTENVPGDCGGPLLKARLAADQGNDAAAEKILSDLIDIAPGDPAVFDAARAFYSRTGKLETLARRLQARLETRPRDVPVVAEVVTLFTSMARNPEAIRVLDVSRTEMATDPVGLYPLANLYSKAGEPGTAVELLRQVLALDPNFSAACNDLAFYLIDDGSDLNSAADLIDHALKLEPDNPAFLDSLGWLQYKRGDFKSAVDTLKKAVGPAVGGEPTVLDHYGDALKKSDQIDLARQAWTRALTTLGTKPDAQPTLRLQLLQKIGKPTTTRTTGPA